MSKIISHILEQIYGLLSVKTGLQVQCQLTFFNAERKMFVVLKYMIGF